MSGGNLKAFRSPSRLPLSLGRPLRPVSERKQSAQICARMCRRRGDHRTFIEVGIFPEDLLGDLAAFLHLIREPLAVRSSSMLEDTQYHPFAGVYETYMIPEQSPGPVCPPRTACDNDQKGLRVNVLSMRKGLFQGHRLPAGRREDVGHRAENGGMQHGNAFLSRFFRRDKIL